MTRRDSDYQGVQAPPVGQHAATGAMRGVRAEPSPRTPYEVVAEIVGRLRETRYAQVEGYNRFGFVRTTDHAVIVSREAGEDTPIPFSTLEEAVKAVRRDPTIYDNG